MEEQKVCRWREDHPGTFHSSAVDSALQKGPCQQTFHSPSKSGMKSLLVLTLQPWRTLWSYNVTFASPEKSPL